MSYFDLTICQIPLDATVRELSDEDIEASGCPRYYILGIDLIELSQPFLASLKGRDEVQGFTIGVRDNTKSGDGCRITVSCVRPVTMHKDVVSEEAYHMIDVRIPDQSIAPLAQALLSVLAMRKATSDVP